MILFREPWLAAVRTPNGVAFMETLMFFFPVFVVA